MLAVDNTRILNVGRRLRLAWAINQTRRLRFVVDDAVARCPWVRATLVQHPILFRPLTSGFLDLRLSRKEQFESFAHDLDFTSTLIHREVSGFFPATLFLRLWQDPLNGYAVDLNMNLDHPQEGLWTVALHDPHQPRLFRICFSVIAGPRLFVGSVQGGQSDGTTKVADLIRAATKNCHGLRPHFLLFDVLRTLASIWRIGEIRGIATNRQLKAQSSGKRARAVRFSYDGYFKELGGLRALDGNWDVPADRPARSDAEIPSRKRTMYRRRAEFIAGMRAAVSASIRGAASG